MHTFLSYHAVSSEDSPSSLRSQSSSSEGQCRLSTGSDEHYIEPHSESAGSHEGEGEVLQSEGTTATERENNDEHEEAGSTDIFNDSDTAQDGSEKREESGSGGGGISGGMENAENTSTSGEEDVIVQQVYILWLCRCDSFIIACTTFQCCMLKIGWVEEGRDIYNMEKLG